LRLQHRFSNGASWDSRFRRETEVIMPLGKRATAEFIGTFWLVFGGCGTAVLAAAFPAVGVGLLGVGAALAVLGGADYRRCDSRVRVSGDRGRTSGESGEARRQTV